MQCKVAGRKWFQAWDSQLFQQFLNATLDHIYPVYKAYICSAKVLGYFVELSMKDDNI